MKLRFDPGLKIAGIGIVPWTRLGPEQWLPQYAIASLYGWDLRPEQGVPPVHALSDMSEPLSRLPKLNTSHLLATSEFQELLNARLPGYDLLTYKPVQIPDALRGRKFLMVNPSYTQRFENKVEFRELFHERVRFPGYAVYRREQLPGDPASFDKLMAGRERIVVQDEQLSGGKGTFIIANFDEYRAALEALNKLSQHERVVVSDAIESPRERSIQCCVTQYGVFSGPLQRQIVRHPLLANMAVPEGDKFCGAQILAADQNTDVHQEAERIAREIGQVLQAEGYRGIFGIDFLMDAADELFVLEINPRITGVTPLLTALFTGETGVPFYLLHLLELGGYDYTIEDTYSAFDADGSLLVLHSLEIGPVRLLEAPRSGTYAIHNEELVHISDNVALSHLRAQEFIIQEYVPVGMPIKPGGRLLTLQFAQAVIDSESDVLYNTTQLLIQAVQKQLKTEPITP